MSNTLLTTRTAVTTHAFYGYQHHFLCNAICTITLWPSSLNWHTAFERSPLVLIKRGFHQEKQADYQPCESSKCLCLVTNFSKIYKLHQLLYIALIIVPQWWCKGKSAMQIWGHPNKRWPKKRLPEKNTKITNTTITLTASVVLIFFQSSCSDLKAKSKFRLPFHQH